MNDNPEKLANDKIEKETIKSLEDSEAELTFMAKVMNCRIGGEKERHISVLISEANKLLLETRKILERSNNNTQAILHPNVRKGHLEKVCENIIVVRRRKTEIRQAILAALNDE